MSQPATESEPRPLRVFLVNHYVGSTIVEAPDFGEAVARFTAWWRMETEDPTAEPSIDSVTLLSDEPVIR